MIAAVESEKKKRRARLLSLPGPALHLSGDRTPYCALVRSLRGVGTASGKSTGNEFPRGLNIESRRIGHFLETYFEEKYWLVCM